MLWETCAEDGVLGKGVLMNYVVFDLEWNQSNTGKEKEAERLPFEILEIGAVKLDEKGECLDEFTELIRPKVYHEMNRITQRMIGLKISELKYYEYFPQIAKKFEDWCGPEEYLFCTWGTLDLMELQRNRKFYNMKPLSDGPMRYLDAQKLFALTFDREDPRKRRSLEDAVDFLKIKKDIPFHRALSDAYYTGKTLQVILEQNPAVLESVSYDTFYPPKDRKSEIRHQFPTYFKYISRTFPDKKALLTDWEIASSKCYLCRKNLKKKIKWFSPNGRHYYCLAYCEKHGFLKGKIRVNKTQEGMVYAVKTTKLISAEEAETIEKRWEHVHEIKKRPDKGQETISPEQAESAKQKDTDQI